MVIPMRKRDRIIPGDCCLSIIVATVFQFFYISVICHSCVFFCLERLIALYYIQVKYLERASGNSF